jgi:hypothetical protein
MRQIKGFSGYSIDLDGKVYDSKGNCILPVPDGHNGLKILMLDDLGKVRQREPNKLFKAIYTLADISNEPIIYHKEGTYPLDIIYTEEHKELQSIFNYNPVTGKLHFKVDNRIAGTLGSHGYRQVHYKCNVIYVHVIIVKMLLGDIVEVNDAQIDHIDRNRDNNIWTNLRIVSKQTNLQNKNKYKSNKSGVTGVWWSKSTNKWQVAITVNKQSIHLGVFNDIEEAIQARREAETKYNFHFSHGK